MIISGYMSFTQFYPYNFEPIPLYPVLSNRFYPVGKTYAIPDKYQLLWSIGRFLYRGRCH